MASVNEPKTESAVTHDVDLETDGTGNSFHAPYTEEEERAVVRKIDLVILPIVCFAHGIETNNIKELIMSHYR